MRNTAAALPEIELSRKGVRVPKQWLATRGSTAGAGSLNYAFVAGEIFSYSTQPQENEENRPVCIRTYSKFCEKLDMSPATVGRALRRIKNNELVEKVRRSEYRSIITDAGEFIVIPYWLFTTEFNINGTVRRLTPSERALFAVIYHFCNNKKRGRNKLNRSLKELGNMLGLHPSTVSRLTDNLHAAGLIVKDSPARDRHGIRVITYHVNKKLLSDRSRGGKVSKEPSEDPEQANIARISWYAQRRQSAEDWADMCKQKAHANTQYRENARKLARIAFASGFTHDVHELTRLSAEQRALEQAQLRILAQLNLTPSDLEPRYHCARCNDTGFDRRGRPCRCYEDSRR